MNISVFIFLPSSVLLSLTCCEVNAIRAVARVLIAETVDVGDFTDTPAMLGRDTVVTDIEPMQAKEFLSLRITPRMAQ